MEGYLLYLMPTNLNVNLTPPPPQTSIEISRIMFDQIFEHYDRAKLTHKMKYHSSVVSGTVLGLVF